MRWTPETVKTRIRELPVLRTAPSAYALKYRPSPDWQIDGRAKGLRTIAASHLSSTIQTGRVFADGVRFSRSPSSGDAPSIITPYNGFSRLMTLRT